MAQLPTIDPVLNAVENREIVKPLRPYLGMSEVGSKCQRKIWYSFRWAYKVVLTPREMRILERGKLEEPDVLRDLAEAGMSVTGEQSEIIDETGHIKGHVDGIVTNVPGAERIVHILEIKTMNNQWFNQYRKNGLVKSHYEYYVQVNQYMGWLSLTRTLFVSTNKDTEERVFERIKFDKQCYRDYKRIAFEVVIAGSPPPRIGTRTYLECKFCRARNICHFDAEFERNCRTCRFSSPEDRGLWSCSRHNMNLTEYTQRIGCGSYELMPELKENV